jgi:tRNA pseudouridine38-40 synthase
MKRVLMKIAYLGSGFSGSQTQPGMRTVESQVLSDLRKVLKTEDPELELSSRTDRGVNALGNAIAFLSPMDDLRTLSKALNSVTDGIFYRQYCEIDGDFNVRHASRRIYRYVLDADGIDLSEARRCCGLFEGTHDFLRFCRFDGKPTVLTIDRL